MRARLAGSISPHSHDEDFAPVDATYFEATHHVDALARELAALVTVRRGRCISPVATFPGLAKLVNVGSLVCDMIPTTFMIRIIDH